MGERPIAVLITDTHLDEDNFDLVKSAHKQAIAIAKKYKLKSVYHLGDHFESRTSQSLAILLGMSKIIDLYEESGIVLYSIAGNHDKTDQSVSESYIDIYKSDWFKNVDGQIIKGENVEFHFLSYYEEGKYQEKLAELQNKSKGKIPAVLLTHYGIDGVLNNDDRAVESNVKANSFKFYKRVFIGHYHNASNPTKTIHYIGSTDPRNFGEDDKKGATVIYSDLTFKQERFKFKSYKKIVIEDFDFDSVDELIKAHSDEDSHIKLEFVGARDKLIKVDKKKLNDAGIQVTTVDTTLINIEGKTDKNEVTIGMSRKDILKHLDEYSKENEIPRKNLAKIIKKF